jgi:hypothetical protein
VRLTPAGSVDGTRRGARSRTRPANAGPDALAARLEQVPAEYLASEAMHGHQDDAGDGGPAIELF